ncbi:DUF1217 domain-containing protein [Methylobacterium gregans]|uniref:DUF1217 domain-containing protein n=1 Tax=Methylobacterium gregans TaxID=374424 RepID=A0AA37HM56_9HYPH|nr:DUF1217 domain-containing protein [Methylobacterium gregans]MDQ0521008.1 hypothetical protein [Methylobacterium gregans]GJD77936.1 hypothetical protein NBEOAGPD_1148 [Methylobacterium gregans]GLS54174.1 hypothetical protein GCM10007886_23570 [Methylobacterium gregans]
MTSTLTSYTLIARDLTAAMKRKAADPTVARESAYYAANIGKVTSVDDLLADRRLYTYAMKAFGLEDMTYAKAFMRKVLSEGASSPSSFANRLADDRYVAIAKAFDFASVQAAKGSDAILAGSDEAAAAAARLEGAVLPASLDFSGTNEARFTLTTQLATGKAASATIVLNKDTLADFASDLAAVKPAALLSAIQSQIAASGEAGLKGKVQVNLDIFDSLIVTTTAYTDLGADQKAGGTGADADTAYAGTGAARTVTLRVAAPASGQTAVSVGFGTNVAPDLAAQTVTDAYLRQSIEADAGADDTGVRLALYFARKAPSVKSAYDILGDTALTQVANTLLGLPASSSTTSSDALAQRAKRIAEKIDLASLKDPAALEKLVRRFAAIWDAQNNTASAPVLALFTGDDGSAGITADMMSALRAARTGG